MNWLYLSSIITIPMKKILLLLLVACSSLGYSQRGFWSVTNEQKLSSLEKLERSSMPSQYHLFQLNIDGLKQSLLQAPDINSGTDSNVIIAFPNADGKMEQFKVFESSVLEKELQERHPELRSFVAKGIDNPALTMHLSSTLFGIHGMIRGNGETYYIDPYTDNLQNYIVYKKSSLIRPKNKTPFMCDTDQSEAHQRSSEFPNQTFANDGVLRTYRMAMTCTIEYSAFHVNRAGVSGGTLAQKKSAVLNAMGVTVTRLNSVYEIDAAVRMVLIANNENIIFIDSDSFDNNNPSNFLSQIQAVVDGIIGAGNYDIGHGNCTSDSGVAILGSVCSSSKARGITGQTSPVGDPFDIDYVAHEVGHQFGATHTFNNSCGGNRSGTTAVEPGSGSTVMAYTGICPPNVQSNSDAYFHAVSLAQMFTFVQGSGSCGAITATGNTAPVITPLTNYTIPKGTAFILKGNGTDANGDALTYTWEQTNPGTNSNTATATTTASIPNFRSVAPSASPNRYMPDLSSVLAGNLSPTWEVIPNVARTMNFALTARDNRANGGQTARQNMTVTFNAATGPFKVTSQAAEAISYAQNSTQTVTWDVAGTNAAPISTANVNIWLSTDGGLTFSTPLAMNTPNDGTESVTIPNIAAPFCRIMIEAVNNIYYAVNANNFSIGYTVTTTCQTYTSNTAVPIPDGTAAGPGAVVGSTINVPATGNISDINVNVNVTHSWYSDLTIAFNHPDNTQVGLMSGSCNGATSGFNVTFDDAGSGIVCAANLTGTFAPLTSLSALNGKPATGNYVLLIRDNAAQDTGTLNSWSIEVCTQTVTLSTDNFGLTDFKIYPNPNNGNFNVQFASNSGNDVQVSVHDMGGRQIFNKTYQSASLFDQNLNLSTVQTGMYMVTVQDGERKEVKKIIVN
ncbi:T9SS type A sorting domain-containing protein [Flavobacterium sp. NST-5]|uniref:T9SS type A sorting domain-containing protein n=1 Tax=Flavobacterium ichthyis TaxID=2698827 RepID=A0ABW9Z732_9FLAO|nr:zinc-dependent metalloprotease family protein [Flavobacterium ichthyis]NBL64683.1 T9SS type A sorting domain-containing protein [Flavobacterium ichthyis]